MKYILFIISISIVGCNIKLDTQVPILPNLKGELPKSSGIDIKGTSTVGGPTDKSKTEGQQGTKTAVMNLKVDEYIEKDTGMRASMNCIQMVQLENGTVLVDFSNQPCPASTQQTVDPNSIKFTAIYNQVREGEYELAAKGVKIGLMYIDFDGPSVTLRNLCNGGYNTACFLFTDSLGRIDNVSGL